MKTPAWSRLRVSFGEKVRAAFLSVTILGSVIRIDNVVPDGWSFLLSGNRLVSWATCNTIIISSIELTYLSSIFYLVALGVFSYALPRDIQITKSRDDYVKRSLKALNGLNVGDWLKNYLHQNEKIGPIAPEEVITHLSQYEAYCVASSETGRPVDFDKAFKSHIIHALQCRYNHYNRESGENLRRAAFYCVLASGTLGAVVMLDSIIQTLIAII